MHNVIVADDHAVTRRGLCELLRDAYKDVWIFEAGDARAVIEGMAQRSWDLVLLDVMMPDTNIVDMIRHVRSIDPAVPVLVVTAATDLEYVIQSMKAGANGVIHKSHAPNDLLSAIVAVGGGGSYLHPETAVAVASALRMAPEAAAHEALSARELEIFKLIALGRAIKEIACDLGLSDKTVATYLGRIREKTGLLTPVDIARYALRKGLVD